MQNSQQPNSKAAAASTKTDLKPVGALLLGSVAIFSLAYAVVVMQGVRPKILPDLGIPVAQAVVRVASAESKTVQGVQIKSPLTGAAVAKQDLNVKARASENQRIGSVQAWIYTTVEPAGAVAQEIGTYAATLTRTKVSRTHYAGTIPAAALPTSGSFTLAVRAYTVATADKPARLLRADMISLSIDTAAPTVTIVAPVNGATVDGPDVDLQLTATDDQSFSSAAYKLDAKKSKKIKLNTQGTAVINLEELAAGSHTVVVTVTDAAGNQATATSTFTVQVQEEADAEVDEDDSDSNTNGQTKTNNRY